MDSVLRALIVYVFLFLLLRLSGKRTLAQITPFDFVLILIISEAVQNGLVGDDHSMSNAFLIVSTLVLVDIGLSQWKQRSKRMARILEGLPLVIVRDGRPLQERMDASRVDESDILEAARMYHGLEKMEQVKYAVLERDGAISIIPKRPVRA
jgi:uncharacterized membrane protein YcaP (DUF421 family)